LERDPEELQILRTMLDTEDLGTLSTDGAPCGRGLLAGPQDAEKKRKRKSPAEAGPSQKFGVAEYQQHMRVRLLVGCRKVTLCRNCGEVSKNATDRIGRLW
jgi:hypothetical protein